MKPEIIARGEFSEALPEQHLLVEKELTPTLIATELGIKNYTHLGHKGDLIGALTQITMPGGRLEPSLLLANQRSPRERHVYIPLSQAWEMVEPNVMVRVVPQFAEKLYGFPTKFDHERILDAIYEWLDDLVKAPPPKWMTNQQQIDALFEDGWLTRRNGEVING